MANDNDSDIMGLTGMNIPQSFQNLSNMNGGIVGNGAPTQFSQAPGVAAPPVSQNSASDQFFRSAGQPSTSRVVSTAPTAGGSNARYMALMQQLMGQFGQQNTAQQGQYQQLLKSLVGKNGITAQLQDATKNYGAGQQELLAENQKQQTGQLNQDLTSRGLGNSTIRSSELSGLNRNQNIAQQNLASNIAQQKMQTLPQQANIQQGAFNANPFNQQQGEYMNLISHLAQG